MSVRRRKKEESGQGVGLSKIIKILFAFIFIVLLVTVGGTVTYYVMTLDLPGIDALKDYRPSIASSVYDENDELIDEFFMEDRKVIKINDVPKMVQHAFVSAEDSRFYQHKGFDLQSIFRAMFKNVEAEIGRAHV